MITIRRYTPSDKPQWDAFVSDSRNGTFLFMRDYMDYHADRFADHSLMCFDQKQRLVALLPANEREHQLYSHQGLTYGGFVTSAGMQSTLLLEIFDQVLSYLGQHGIVRWHYKSMPTIYHRCPAQEDEYALWLHGAQLEACLLSVTIPLQGNLFPALERRRRRGMQKALDCGCTIRNNADVRVMWPIMEENLDTRYNARPVHTVDEMLRLQQSFPQNIECFLVEREGTPVAGALIYKTPQTIHVQYGHASPEGKMCGALDLLYIRLIERFREQGYAWFDLGTSNEQGGRILNHNLVAQKEGFGGRGVTYKQWVMDIPLAVETTQGQ